ncbi:MAG: DUF4270 domain-containing protein, partial [Cytophagales bacterium]|nr:DUF4270 domain-containing protein [Cytophagales bacterium]
MLLLALFSFSCEDTESLDSIGKIPDRTNTFYTEFTLPSSLLLKDSINTTYPSRWLVGKYQDSKIGELSHEFYTMLQLTADSLKTSSSGTNNFEGLYLTLEADGYIFGSDETISLNVHELNQTLRNTFKKDIDNYYSKDEIPVSQFKRKISTENSFNLNEDSTLTIRLIDELGQEFFRRQNEFSDKENFTQKDFNEFFKG